jgi:competence protein ComEC
MEIFRFISVKLVLGLIAGILVGYFLQPPLLLPLLLVGSGLLILGIPFNSKKQTYFPYFATVSTLLTISIGCLAFSLSRPENRFDHYSHVPKHKNAVWHVKIREVLKPTSYSDRYIALVQGVDARKASGKIILNVPTHTDVGLFQVDDELMVLTQPHDIGPPLNPHQFDYKKYLKNMGVTAQTNLNATNYLRRASATTTIFGITAHLRDRITAKLRRSNFGEAQLGIIQALLLGQRNDILKETYDDYKNAGAVHILAISGLHIGIILLLLQFLLKPLERLAHGKTIKLLLIVLLLWGFALLAGLSASVVRAVTMFSFVAYALFLNRPTSTLNILALSMFFILLINPMFLFHVGFQMSYAAVFAIVWVYPIILKFWSPGNILFRKIWQLTSVSIAAQLGVVPICLFYFHQFPGLFFVSNLLIIPFLGILLGMGILVILLALVNLLPKLLVDLYDFLIDAMNSIVGWVAEQETFIFKDIHFDGLQLVLGYAIIILLVQMFIKPNGKRISAFLVAIIGFQAWTFLVLYQTEQKEELLVLHQARNSVLLHRSGNRLQVITSDSSRTMNMVTDYKVAENIRDISYSTIKNSYLLASKKLLILDSVGVYPSNISTEYLLMTQSPNINLDRAIASLGPSMVIADGSNYRSSVERWKASCEKVGIPFHYTGDMGACPLLEN